MQRVVSETTLSMLSCPLGPKLPPKLLPNVGCQSQRRLPVPTKSLPPKKIEK